jgi:sigma-B regulation protein RsbU (phosphoserine phosphatase)
MWTTLTSGKVFRGTLVNRKKSGDLYWAEQTITPMRDGGANITHFVSVARDVTELRKGQEREIELGLARQVQQRLYPRAAPQIPGLDLAGAARPCALMSGDYYDFIPTAGGQLGIVVGDVSGHGLGPALVMAETRAYLRSCLRTCSNLDETLHLTNEMLVDDLESNYFVTLLLASLDVGAGTLTYANAGHPTGYLLDRSGEVKFAMESTCIPLGVLGDLRGAPGRTVRCEPGDILVLFSDGILESQEPGGEFFGVERALALLRRHRREPARQILDRFYAGVLAFAGDNSLQDDLTAVVCKLDTGL